MASCTSKITQSEFYPKQKKHKGKLKRKLKHKFSVHNDRYDVGNCSAISTTSLPYNRIDNLVTALQYQRHLYPVTGSTTWTFETWRGASTVKTPPSWPCPCLICFFTYMCHNKMQELIWKPKYDKILYFSFSDTTHKFFPQCHTFPLHYQLHHQAKPISTH